MNLRRNFLSTLFFISAITISFSQVTKRNIEASRISKTPKIDGLLDDAIWNTLPRYGNFNMLDPGTEGTISEGYETEFQLAYDDKAVYVAVYLNDPDPDGIASQFSQRDDINVQADYIAIALNTYNDGINETRFGITSAGTIFDSKISINNEDLGYNVVFEGRMSKDAKGWYAEFKIPYRALRFPEIEVQDWSINLYRKMIHINETHSFAPIDNTKGKRTQYNASIFGIKNINPPTRLTLFPFAQGVVSNFEGETETSISAGMDIKYGLSDSFTLDATLIPDFGQAAFDNVTLNLGPFEQTFSEQRQFFKEGTELFNKGRIFFSRRVGNRPSGPLEELGEHEVIDEFPKRVQLLNAIKVSGRTQENLGVGIFNAITERTFTAVRDSITGTIREVEVEPLTNYNIVVLDQQFNDNSSISLINTNVVRNGHFRDANVTAFVFDVSDKENTYNTSGRAIVSNVNLETGNQSGLRTELDIASTQGKFRYRVGHDFANTTYDINDLGLNRTNNYNNFVAGLSYEIFNPTETFNKYRFELTARHSRLYKPSVQTQNYINFNSFFVLPTRFAFGGNVSWDSERDDYFEARVAGRFVSFPESIGGRVWISSDFRKKFALDSGLGCRVAFDDPQRQYYVDFSPRYRFSDKFNMILRSDFSLRNKNFGYVNSTDNEVILGQRNITSLENAITASYNFDPYKAINFRFRNFWTTVDYTENIFFELNEDGTRQLTSYDTTNDDPNANFNIWNLDLSYTWRFAPGSEATLLYRNQIFNNDNESTVNYTESLGSLFDQEIQNTVSLRVTYFIDYNNLKTFLKKDS